MRSTLLATTALAVAAALCAPAAARITQFSISRAEPFAGGMSFGNTGSYQRIVGTAKGELDPNDPRNKGIVNLDKAPRNAAGKVVYDVDFYVMRPTDAAKGNGELLYEVNNRGRKFLLPFLDAAKPSSPLSINDPASAEDAGNGFVFRQGYTIVWSGWDPDAPTANNGMVVRVPVATDHGKPITERIRDEFVFGTRVPTSRATAPLSYEAADLDQGKARLTVRAREGDAAQEIPATGWAYDGARAVRLLPDGTVFKPGYIYDFRYRAVNPKVVGIGLAATRDLVSFLRYEATDMTGQANPLADAQGRLHLPHAIGFGISQSGRYLRDHIAQGFNADEQGRKVFDGVLAHISGIGKLFANEAFAQPYRTNTQHEDHLFPENSFPFAHAAITDPVTGRTAGLLRGDGSDPLVIEVNTSTEYWQKAASLLATDPLGKRDLTIPKTVRLFMIAGTQHGGNPFGTSDPGSCANPRNPHDPSPALRALIVDLDRWVAAGVEPPASRIPTLKDKTLVDPDKTGFPDLANVATADRGNHLALFGSWTDPKPVAAKSYVSRVSKVDDDGNEIAGLRLPDIAVPLATYTGWNLYKAPYPEGELCDRDGSFIAFAKTKAERAAAHDPRPSLEERYAGRSDYVKRMSDAAAELVKARLLLPEDAARYLDAARGAKAFD